MYPNHRPPVWGAQTNFREEQSHILGVIKIWEKARIAYTQLLAAGPDRSDIELSKDSAYAALLSAALELLRAGGPDAVSSVAKHLAETTVGGRGEHFTRFWNGLMPETARDANFRRL